MQEKKLSFIFLGTPAFAVPALTMLVKNGYRPVLVITQPDQRAGRKQLLTPRPVKVVAEKLGLAVAQPKTKAELTKIITSRTCDVGIVVAYGQIISTECIDFPRLGFLNIHPSLLPKYRGASPIQSALLAGDAASGVSIIRLTNDVDAGPIIAQTTVAISSTDTSETLHVKLANAGAELLVKILPDYVAGTAQLKSQDDSLASMTTLITREQGQIDWLKTAVEIERQLRAFTPWPGLFTHWRGKRLKMPNLSVLEDILPVSRQPGLVFLTELGQLGVGCGQGAVVVNVLQLEGKTKVSAAELLRGNPKIVGAVLQ